MYKQRHPKGQDKDTFSDSPIHTDPHTGVPFLQRGVDYTRTAWTDQSLHTTSPPGHSIHSSHSSHPNFYQSSPQSASLSFASFSPPLTADSSVPPSTDYGSNFSYRHQNLATHSTLSPPSQSAPSLSITNAGSNPRASPRQNPHFSHRDYVPQSLYQPPNYMHPPAYANIFSSQSGKSDTHDYMVDSSPPMSSHSTREMNQTLFNEIELLHEKALVEGAATSEKVYNTFKSNHARKGPSYDYTSPNALGLEATKSVKDTPMKDSSRSFSAPANQQTPQNQHNLTLANLQGGMTPAIVQKIVEIFQRNGSLTRDVVMCILQMCIRYFTTLENINRIDHDQIFIKKRTIIVGDLHGQYEDLCYILSTYGSPSEINNYVFNGDYVDRGQKSLEVAITLLSLGLCYPDCVYLNRGNHELRSVNTQYGFLSELSMKKYDPEIFDFFQEAFAALPLITTIGRDVIVVHGGITVHANSWEIIRSVNRFVEATHQSPVVDELLWSDPCSANGIKPSSRGAGLEFGPDATERFLASLGFTTLIRSHEVKDNGYEVTHNGRCITVFSASNYTGKYGNKGAVAILDHTSRLYMYTYSAIDVRGQFQVTISDNDLEVSNMIYIAELIFEKKPLITEKFRQVEQLDRRKYNSKRGLISYESWINVMRDTFPLNIPWDWLRSRIAPGAKPGFIDYNLFLAQYDLDSPKLKQWETEIVHKVATRIYSSKASLGEAFKKFDVNGDGTLSYTEFHTAMEEMDLGLSKEQITHFIISTDEDMDGSVSYDEFIRRFKMQFKKPIGDINEQEIKEVEDLVDKLSAMLANKSMSAKQAFQRFDSDGSGYITFAELIEALASMFGILMTPFQNQYLMDILDSNADNNISYEEFMNAFDVVDLKGNDGGLVSMLASKLFRNRATLRSAFFFLDRDSSGSISREEFVEGMNILNAQLPDAFSDTEISTLMDTLDSNKDGEISYDEFVDSFSHVIYRNPNEKF